MHSRIQVVLSMIDFDLNEESIARMRAYWESVAGLEEVRIKGFITWDGNSEAVNRLAGIEPVVTQEPRAVTCKWPWRSVTVLWDGDVVPCCRDFDKRLVLGNVASETLSSIWNGPRMKALRAEFISGVVTNSLCRGCTALCG
jgi:radical SAM protein with 4Fe4S-binding SPASM domain